MKKNYLIFVAIIAFGIQAQAQSRLTQQGVPSSYDVVERPLLYYDIMRSQLPSWIRHIKQSANANWENLNMVINKKDANGRLSTLSFFSYNATESKWDTRIIHLYQYEMSGTNIISEKRNRWIYDGTDISSDSIIDTFSFQNNKLLKRDQFASYGTISRVNQQFYTYDNTGRLLSDSSSISFNSNVYSTKADYYYNNNNQCIKYVVKIANDTSYYYNYGYTLNKLTLYESYSFSAISGKTLVEKEEYTYDNQGRVDEVTIYNGYSTPVTNRYKHGYTQDSKLLWMTMYEKNNATDTWLKEDSTVINYKNGIVDTSYGYISGNGTTWNNWSSLRYVFNTNFVGINAVAQGRLSFNVYPNPTRETLNIQLNEKDNVKRITVTDLLGRTLMVSTEANPIHIEHIKPGTYFVTVETDQNTGTKKFIVTE